MNDLSIVSGHTFLFSLVSMVSQTFSYSTIGTLKQDFRETPLRQTLASLQSLHTIKVDGVGLDHCEKGSAATAVFESLP